MTKFILSVLLPISIVFSSGNAFALEPVMVRNIDMAWRSVQGDSKGNPLVSFKGDLTSGKSIRERFTGIPTWIVSEDFDGDGQHEAAVKFVDGTMKVISLSGGRLKTIATARKLSPETPPVVLNSFGEEATGGLIGIDAGGDLVTINYKTGRTRRIAGGFSPLSHPVAIDLNDDGNKEILAISDEGFLTVVLGRIRSRTNKSVKLLLDTRITVADMNGDGILEIVALSSPTDEISPGRLGDDIEAQGVAIFNWESNTIRFKTEFELSDDQVFETLTPFIVGNGDDEGSFLMLPVADGNRGSLIRSYSYNGIRMRERRKSPISDADQRIQILGNSEMGTGKNRYLITALSSEDDKGDLVLYRLDLTQAKITLRSSINTHASGSRLVETVLIGDMTRDGEIELLAPGENRSDLAVYSLDRNVLKENEIFNSSRKIGTNLCPGDFNGDGFSDVMFGLDDGTLVILFGE